MKLKEIREKKKALFEEMKKFNDEIDGRSFKPEETEKWEKCSADYEALKAAEKRQEAIDAEEKILNDAQTKGSEFRSDPNKRTQTKVERHLRAMCKSRLGGILTPEEEEVLRNTYGRDQFCEVKLFDVPPKDKRSVLESRNYITGTDNLGGTTVPVEMVNQIELAKLQFGNVRGVSSILRTATGVELNWPTGNDTGNKGELVAEAGAVTVDTATPFAEKTLNSYKYSSKIFKMSFELLRDNAVNLEAVFSAWAGERLARKINEALTTGDGSSKPNGIATASALGVTAASATAITMDETKNLKHSVDPAYRDAAGYMMNDTTLLLVSKLKDSDGRYIWTESTRVGDPDRLWGHPVTINQDMPAPTTGLKPMIFGDFSTYKVREVGSIRIIWINELYVVNDQKGLVAFESVDGELLNAGTNPVKHLIMA